MSRPVPPDASPHAPSPTRSTNREKPSMTSCTAPARTALARTGALALVFGSSIGLALGPAASALAQDAVTANTVQAVIGADGKVTSVTRLGSKDAAPAADALPVTLGVTDTTADGVRSLAYHVENTTTQKKTVTYPGPDGTPVKREQDVALPLVGQLSVRLPATLTDVSAVGARVTALADGSHELVWSLVLFAPVGATTADVSFTAKGTGNPVARLDSQAVQPNATPGLSSTAQSANATINGNGILTTVSTGASEGLMKLSSGVGQLLAGLTKLEAGSNKLHDGLGAAVAGSNQLADGSAKAKDGSGKLAAGLGKLSTGAGQLSAGAGKLDVGTGKISDGLGKADVGGEKLAAGGKQLATGATAAAVGAKSLAEGLALISGGLGQLSATQGLPAALDGAKRLRAGVDQLRAGLGAPETEGTILNGLTKIGGGLGQVKGGLDALGAPTGLPAAKGGVDASKGGVDQVRAGFAEAVKAGGAIDQLSGGLKGAKDLVDSARQDDGCLTGSATPTATTSDHCAKLNRASGTLAALSGGVDDPKAGLKASTSAAVAGLGQVSGGLGQVSTGLGSAIAGVGQLSTGVGALQTGNSAVSAGVVKIAQGLMSGDPTKPGVAEGLDSLVAGLTAAVDGVGKLSAGSQAAATGASALAVGNGKIAAGNGALAVGAAQLEAGLDQLYGGSKQLKAGTSALSVGSGKLAAGAQAAATGAGQLDTGLGKIAAGQRKVADGLPAAVDGSGQIADGLGKVVVGQTAVKKGLGDVQTKAVAVLASQFRQGTDLARQQLAGLDAASALITSTPGAGSTTYVLTQDEGGIVANLSSSSSDSSTSHTGRNVGLGLGGVALLAAGLGGGFAAGRKRTTA